MQKHNADGVTLHCDYCGRLWDMHEPMIEGHQGSVLCLACLARAIDDGGNEPAKRVKCTLCLRDFDPGDGETIWQYADPPAEANAQARLCGDCAAQADRAFDRDPDTNWTRKLSPSKRWR